MINLAMLQNKIEEWNQRNFPNAKPIEPLLGLVEEIGELSHAHLKSSQGIRGTENELFLEKVDAVGDIFIFLSAYCSLNGIDLELAIRKAWSEVRQRDWIKYPKDGRTE